MKQFISKFLLSLSSLILALTVIILPAQAVGVYDLPVVNAAEDVWIVDQAQTLSLANENRLKNTLEKFAENSDYELRMIVIHRLDYGQTINDLADQVFTKWYPNQEDQDNQILLIMDTLTNQTAIRYGNNVKANLTDEKVDSIISETIAYLLKEGKYNQALLDGSDRLVAILSGKEDPGPVQIKQVKVEGTFPTAEETDDKSATIWVVGFLIVATIIPMVTYYWYVK